MNQNSVMLFKIVMLMVLRMFNRAVWADSQYQKLRRKIDLEYGIVIDVSQITFAGWFTILKLTNLHLGGKKLQYDITAVEIEVSWGIMSLIRHSRIAGLKIQHMTVAEHYTRPVTTGPLSNGSGDAPVSARYISTLRRALRFLSKLPSECLIQDLKILVKQSFAFEIQVKEGRLQNGVWLLKLGINQGKEDQNVSFEGELSALRNQLNIKINSQFQGHFKKNISDQSALVVECRGLTADLTIKSTNAEQMIFSSRLELLYTKVNGFLLSDGQSSASGYELSGHLNSSELIIQKGSFIKFKKLNFYFQMVWGLTQDRKSHAEVTLKSISIAEVLSSIPKLTFAELYTVSFSGKLGMVASIHFDGAPSLAYGFDVKTTDTPAIVDLGNLNLMYLNSPFAVCINEDVNSKHLVMHPSSPHFISIESVPQNLLDSIVVAEDRNFFLHEGFDLPAIGLAILTNLARKRFSRGASTITMQLVKNLFLNHDRNLVRKIEEIFLTFFVEQVFKIEKRRILELYLNLVEFAPQVYGVQDAASYYFDKAPENLSLVESLVLSYIIPRPKHFVEALASGSPILTDNLRKHIEDTSSAMVRKGMISDEERLDIKPSIQFALRFPSLNLENSLNGLSPVLQRVFHKASSAWGQTYKSLPKPYISAIIFRPDAQNLQGPHALSIPRTKIDDYAVEPDPSFPSQTFEVIFKDNYGNQHSTDSLFIRFADLIKTFDEENQILWGGNDLENQRRAQFKLKVLVDG